MIRDSYSSIVECVYGMDYIHTQLMGMATTGGYEDVNFIHLLSVVSMVRNHIADYTIMDFSEEDDTVPCAICGEQIIDIYPNIHIDTMNIECLNP